MAWRFGFIVEKSYWMVLSMFALVEYRLSCLSVEGKALCLWNIAPALSACQTFWVIAPMNQPTPFHRLFGYSWIDFFDGTDIEVETELDLSIKKQLIDLIIVRKGAGPVPRPMPDGFEILSTYNLVTFKSYQEALEAWTLQELVGHYVNYRKRISPSIDNPLPSSEFRLFAVSARYPSKLTKEVDLLPVKSGVYDVIGIGLTIRVIVVNELPEVENNAMLHLFSAREELIRFGQEHYRPHSTGTSTLLYQLLKAYSEDQSMSEKMKEFVRQSIDEFLRSLPAEERLKGLPAEERLKGLPAEERLKGLPAEERLKGLPAEERLKGLPAEERLKGLSADEVIQAMPPEVLEALQRRLKENGSFPKPE
jgi:hypothetical protein